MRDVEVFSGWVFENDLAWAEALGVCDDRGLVGPVDPEGRAVDFS